VPSGAIVRIEPCLGSIEIHYVVPAVFYLANQSRVLPLGMLPRAMARSLLLCLLLLALRVSGEWFPHVYLGYRAMSSLLATSDSVGVCSSHFCQGSTCTCCAHIHMRSSGYAVLCELDSPCKKVTSSVCRLHAALSVCLDALHCICNLALPVQTD